MLPMLALLFRFLRLMRRLICACRYGMSQLPESKTGLLSTNSGQYSGTSRIVRSFRAGKEWRRNTLTQREVRDSIPLLGLAEDVHTWQKFLTRILFNQLNINKIVEFFCRKKAAIGGVLRSVFMLGNNPEGPSYRDRNMTNLGHRTQIKLLGRRARRYQKPHPSGG